MISICFNPVVSLPNNNFVRQSLEKLEFYACMDFFLNETARYSDIVFPGSLHEETDCLQGRYSGLLRNYVRKDREEHGRLLAVPLA